MAGFFDSTTCQGACYPTAFVYSNGTVTEIPEFINAPGGNSLTPINDADQVVDSGSCSDPSAQLPCTNVWQNGTITSLAQCDCATFGLNNSLQIVGQWYQLPGVPNSPSGRALLYPVDLHARYGERRLRAGRPRVLRTVAGARRHLHDQHPLHAKRHPHAALSLSPSSLTFASQAVGTASSAQFVTVTNTGSAPLTFTQDTVSGDFALAGLGDLRTVAGTRRELYDQYSLHANGNGDENRDPDDSGQRSGQPSGGLAVGDRPVKKSGRNAMPRLPAG